MKDVRPTLFYSWQSDDSKTRNYIESAIKSAIKKVTANMQVEDAPRLDKDTQGEVGAVSITATIKRKISASKIFIADVSLVETGKSGKKLANQNVMFELGYAFGKKTEKAVMLIANKDLGSANELPFDIAQNRIVFCSPNDDPKADVLVPVLEYAIRAHLGFVDEELRSINQIDIKDQLLSAIENGRPTQTKAENYFEHLYKRYLEIGPEPSRGGELYVDLGERMADAYQKTLPLIVELSEVINMAAEYRDSKTISIGYKMLGNIAGRYDKHSADEYAALVIQEIASITIGALAKFERWEEIAQLMNTTLIKPKGGLHTYKIENTYQYPEGIKQYYNKKKGRDYSIPTTPFIQERFVDNDKILQTYVDGSLILMLALGWYYPYVTGLLLGDDESYTPDYLSKLRSTRFAQNFSQALGIATVEELRDRITEKCKQPLSDGLAYWNRDLSHLFSDSGVMPLGQIGAKT